MAAFTSLAASTTAGAEPSPFRTLVFPCDKGGTAEFAGSFFPAPSGSKMGFTKWLIVLNASPTKGIAHPTGGNQVFRPIIQRIAIDMISEKRSLWTTTSPNEPVEFSATPEAGMRTPADLVKEYRARFGNHSAFARKRMGRLMSDSAMSSAFKARPTHREIIAAGEM